MCKKLLGVILAIAMILSLFPATVFATGEVAENENVKIEYNLYSKSTSGTLEYFTEVTLGLSGKLTEVFTDYTKSNGFWRFADLLEVPTSVTGHTTYNSGHIVHGGGWLFYTYPQNWYALGFNVPKEGTYNLVLTSYARDNGGKFAYTVLPGGTSSDAITSKLANVSWDSETDKLIDPDGATLGVIDCSLVESSPAHEVTFPEAGEYLLVFKNVGATSGKNELHIDRFILQNGNGSVSVPMGYTILADEDNTIAEGKTTTATISTLYGSGDWKKKTYADDKITFISSDTDVATVSADGTVTAKKEGTAEITAVVDGTPLVSAPLTVTGSNIKILYDIYSSFTPSTMEYYTEISSKIEHQALISGFADYTKSNGFWRRALPLVGSGHRVEYGNWLFFTSSDNWYALSFHVPKAGTYKLIVNSAKTTAGGKFAYTVLPGGTSGDNITSELANVSWDTENSKLIDADNKALGVMDCTVSAASPEHELTFPEAGEYLLVFKNIYHGTHGYLNIDYFTLTNGTGAVSVPMGYTVITDDDKTIEVGGTTTVTTSTLYGSGDWMKKTADQITFTSSDTEVAEVSADGTVTAKAVGAAEITAIVDGAQLVSETIKVEEKKISLAVANNVDETISVEAYKAGSVTVEAAEKTGHTFSHWVRGTADNGVWVYSDASYTFDLVSPTYLTAIYVANDAKIVEFFNGNSELLAQETVNADGTVEPPVNPSMVGFKFLRWITAKDVEFVNADITAPLTRVVAEFEDDTATYTVEGQTGVKYDTAITKTSDNEVAWKRGDVVVGYGTSYTYNVWADVESITSETISEKKPLVYIDPTVKSVGDEKACMIEFDGAGKEIVEVGILFSSTGIPEVGSCQYKATSKTNGGDDGHGQFTAKPANSTQTVARGYLIYNENGEYKTAYSEVLSLS